MAAVELDVPRLSAFCSLPSNSIETLIDTPTVELVRTLLSNISERVREFDGVKSEKLKLTVELENAVRGGESKSRVLKGAVDKGLKDIADLREKLHAAETSRISLKQEFEEFKSSNSSSVSEVSSLKARIDILESSSRDALSLLESKSTAYDKLAEELAAQHQKTVELRRQVSNLEQSIQSANAASASAAYHEQGLQQEVEHLKRSNEWLDKELKTKSEEYSKYRKEKGSRLAELQRQNDEAANTIDSLNRAEGNLRKRYEEVSQKADDYLSRIQQLQEEAARKDEAFNVEMIAANRLTELMKNSANTEKQRQQDLHEQLETAKEETAEQIGRMAAEIDTEHRNREASERRIAELEVQVERLEADVVTLQSQSGSQRGINGHTTPSRTGSPAAGEFDGPSRLKAGFSITQLLSDLNDTKADLNAANVRNEKLAEAMNNMLQDLEVKQPEIEEVYADNGRLQSELAEVSSLLEDVGKERDQALKDIRKKEGQVEAKMKEGEVLRQQLRDLSSQIKVLLMEAHLKDQGITDISGERQLQLERLAQVQSDDVVDNATDTDRVISENLVAFKTIAELQEQNANLIKVTREVGERMEREEALKKQSEAAQDQEELRQNYERCKDEIKSLVTQSQSYIRERDMFRRLLLHRGQLPPGSDINSMFGESVNEGQPPTTPKQAGVLDSIEQSPSSKDMADYAKLLKDMQSHFDAYRNEAATDRSTLKSQVDSLSKSNGELRNEVARSNSQVSLAHERYEMLQANYAMLKNENVELQKKSQFFSDNVAKQDLRTQRVAEDLVEAKGLLDSMRNEIANLKAEKEFWKTIEKRLTTENQSFLEERTRVSNLNTSLQNLLNEREYSENELRRRFQSQIESLENELQITKARLSEETEESKRVTLRREYDLQQSQKKIDDLVSSLGSTREEFVAAKTTRDHLQTRLDEMIIELRSAEERVHVLQPAPRTNPEIAQNGEAPVESSESGEGISREQELKIEVSELKRDLELSKGELESAKNQVEQYKAISQASEEELQSLNETQDLYRQETDKVIEERNTKIGQLEERINDISSELASTNLELTDLRNSQAENGRRLEEQKASFEAEMAQLKDQDDRHATAAKYHQEDLKAQAEIAQQAQSNYDNELMKHAEAAKALQKVRTDYNQLKVEIVELKTDAESARTGLVQSEESWADTRERYERELADLRTGKENLNVQNNRLHQQLEDISAQITSLQKRVTTSNFEDHNGNAPTSSLENLQEVIKYLRREKEIVDVQLELSAQEAKRLKQQLDYTQIQLDETRLRLNQQRRLEEDSERAAMTHNKLMETLNELNTFRESSVTLRNETRQAQTALALKAKEVEELLARIEPLQAEIIELKNEKETQKGEVTLLKEDRDRWQQRTQNILQKYDRVDPVELEGLKEQIKNLETERDKLVSARQTLQEQLDGMQGEVTKAQEQGVEKTEELRQRLTEQFKTRSKNQSAVIREKDSALQSANKEKEDLQQQVAGLQKKFEAAKLERDQAVDKLNSTQANKAEADGQSGAEEGQVDEDEVPRPTDSDMQVLRSTLETAQLELSESSSERTKLRAECAAQGEKIQELRNRISDLEVQITQKQRDLDDSTAKLSQVQQQSSNLPPNAVSEEQAEILRRGLAEALQESENLRASASINESLASAPTEDGSKSLDEQVREHVEKIRADLESRHNERVKQAEETFQKRTDLMKTQFNKKVPEIKDQLRQNLVAEHEKILEKVGSDHEQGLEELKAKHRAELDELKQNEASRLADLKQTWLAEQTTRNPTGESTVKPEAEVSPKREPTEAEARELVTSNATIRGILSRNITEKVAKAKEILAIQLKEEHEKALAEKLAEAQSKANTAKEQAVMTEEKRNSVKLSMSDNRARIASFKLTLVQKAADDTPQKPVVEVWAVVKDARPPQAATQQPHQKTPQSAIVGQSGPAGQGSSPHSQGKAPQAPISTGTFGQPSMGAFGQPSTAAFGQLPPTIPNAAGQTPATTGIFGQPAPMMSNATTSAIGQPTQIPQTVQTNPFAPLAKPQQAPAQAQMLPPHATTNQQPTAPAANPPGQSQPLAASQIPSAPQPSQGPPNGTQPTSNIPVKPQPNPSNQPNAGSGPAALRSLQNSGLPIARGGRGGSGRGGPGGPHNNPRGRGQGRGRGGGGGGPEQNNTAQQQGVQHGRASPTTGGQLNGGAKQFVPGNKRPREDGGEGLQGHGEGGEDGRGKRVRGGAGGS